MTAAAPKISVIMAFHNAGAYFADAIASVLGQTHTHLELILSDDGATDGSAALAEQAAASDPRVRVVTGPNAGPGGARNRALDVVTGAWVAIVDADDLMHPCRLARLLAEAGRLGADMVADDLIHFGAETQRSLLQPLALTAPLWVDPKTLLSADLGARPVSLGYLKPLIRRDMIADQRYDETLQIGEDFDFLLRLVVEGARLAVLPEGYYLYRRHATSISHRLSEGNARAMMEALDRLPVAGLEAVIAKRRTSLQKSADYAAFVAQVKAKAWPGAARALLADLSLLAQLWASFLDRKRRAPEAAVQAQSLTLGAGSDAELRVPSQPQDWALEDVLRVVAASNGGQAQISAIGSAGLYALGFVPGWSGATLVPPEGGWSEDEVAVIEGLVWPTGSGEAGPG